MSYWRIGLLFVAVALLSSMGVCAVRPQYVDNQVLVTLRAGRTEADLASFHAEYGSTVARRLSSGNIFLLNLPAGRSPLDLVGQNAVGVLQRHQAIQAIQLNHLYYVMDTPDDPFYSAYYDASQRLRGQWPYQVDPVDPAIQHIHAPEAWDLQKGSSDVVVAVIDTGVRATTIMDANNTGIYIRRPHPDLAGRVIDPPVISAMVNGQTTILYPDAAMMDADPSPPETDISPGVASHGTQCAGIIAAQGDNAVGVTGLCWNGVRILPIKVCDDASGGLSEVALHEAIEYVIRYRGAEVTSTGEPLRVNVVNLSLGGNAPETPIMASQYRRAISSGIVIVAAAGNDWEQGAYPPGYPAALEDVICVGSTDYRDEISSFSQRGRTLDIVAPGEDVISTAWAKSMASVDIDDDGGDDGGTEPPPLTPGSQTPGMGFQAAETLPDTTGNYIAEFISGTSFSAPVISGAVALLLSHGVPASDVKQILYSTTTPLGFGQPNDTYGWGMLNMRKALEKASIDVVIQTPAKSSIVTSSRPQFRIEFRHALKSSIEVRIDGEVIIGASGRIANWDPYYFTLDSAAGKTYLQFDYPLSAGAHTITATAQTDMNLGTTLSDEDTVRFTVRADTLVGGWHMFSVPYSLDSSLTPIAVIGTTTQLWRYAYADGQTGAYAAYSATGRMDTEATFHPQSVIGMNLVHPLDRTAATPPAGLGYWLRVRSSGYVLPPLDPNLSTEMAGGPYYIGLYNGWNMVGCPFAAPAPWASAVFEIGGIRLTALEAVQMGYISNYIYSYNPSTQAYSTAPMSTAVMQPWKAQWVRVKYDAPQDTNIFNATFQGGFGAVSSGNTTGYVGEYWTAFSTSGNAYFGVGSPGVSDSASQKITPSGSNPGYFSAGIYQQIVTTAGQRLAFSAWTKRQKNCTGTVGTCRWPTGEGTQVGVDPSGGTDPLAPSVVWSTVDDLVGDWAQQVVYAQAESSIVTVFVRTVANTPGTDRSVLIDNARISTGHDVTLIVNPGL